ncbi:IclR family transcriptional regulator [Erythrobacter aureus]|uniref:IclR family transcriptional regulator n=1 Tax=Erythrobacter aureus TaxID=2182384 RepID=A0A345YB06_9SPHN|nr:IclR family transcriptional regulator [Erythrobacter aureus]AXK41108.1 IclR family transcriptional regulator [Erythrobacter aureus]
MPQDNSSEIKDPKKATRRKQYSAPALEKGLDMLELLAREPEPINLKEIAERLGRSVGEIFRMLAVLEQRGYVATAEDSERYRLTMRLFQLAHWHLPINRLTGAATGPMRRLALQTGQSCHLTILSGARVVVVARQDSFKDRSFAMRIGAESPLLASCSGRIFFALADDFTREALIESIKDLGEDTSAAAQVDDVAAALRAQSYLEMPSEQVEGIVDIGTPITDHDGSIAASLVIPFLHRIDKDNEGHIGMVKDNLVRAAAEISSLLGRVDSK